jgi:hypothetical protein
MPRFIILIMAALIVLVPVVASAQTASPPPSSTAPVTGMKPDRTTADRSTRQRMQKRETVLRQKRAACRSEAREQKISVFKRRAFLRRCMAR